MMVRSSWRSMAALGAVVVLAACSAASPSASTPASQAASMAPSTAASMAESMAPSTAESMAPVATVPSDQLDFAGKLVVCIDIPYPPQEFFDAQGNPTGSDVDIAAEIAHRLGLEFEVENSVFDTIIAAVTSGKCDIIVSAQNLTADRLTQVNMIPYFKAGQAFVVAKGNPDGITQPTDLCGKSVAAETGTTEADYVQGTGDYTGAGLDKQCTDAGLQAVDLQQFDKDTDALLALTSGQVSAYFADSPTAGYYTVQQPDQFELSGVTVEIANEGISVPKDRPGLSDAVVTALTSMISDGAYADILKKYGLEDGAVDPADVKVVTK
jgi:polar amino acid transport system substrate-binding protein